MPQEGNLSLKGRMTKMTNKQMFHGALTALAGVLLCTVSFSSLSAQQAKLRIVQTNSAGDNVHIIDPATNKVVGEIKGSELPHGIAAAPDGSRIYISEEAGFTLTVVDGKSLQVTKRIPLSGNPNLVDMTPDGRFLYVAIALTYDDLSEFPPIKAAASGGIHDLNVTPDGKYLIAGASRGAKPPTNVMNVIDTRTNEVVRTVPMNP